MTHHEHHRDDTIDTLNELIETCRDGEEGFRKAAEAIDDSTLAERFIDYSARRGRFAQELAAEVRRLGGDPETKGSPSGAMHRGWMNLKSAVTGDDTGAVIAECERGEDAALERYEDALEKELPGDIRTLVERQYADVKSTHDRVREMERALS